MTLELANLINKITKMGVGISVGLSDGISLSYKYARLLTLAFAHDRYVRLGQVIQIPFNVTRQFSLRGFFNGLLVQVVCYLVVSLVFVWPYREGKRRRYE